MASAPVEVGQVLIGKYRIESVLGEGGMGIVVAARHLQLDEFVAIKFLLPEMMKSAEVVERFARESRAAIKIKSEHVVRVMDVGTLETGAPYMVMELLRGKDLSNMLTDQGSLPLLDAVHYVLQACEAMADAHSIGIVHRDLKPANMFMTVRNDGTPCIKVLDFGISKVSTGPTGSQLSMTKTASILGSPLYMSPEQMTSSRDVDMRADIWSIGAVLYELITGRPPFEADTLPQVCALILQQPPPPMRSPRGELPPGLEAVVLRCLEKDRAKRWPNVAELATALADYGPKGSRSSAARSARVLSAVGLSRSALELVPSSTAPGPMVAAQTQGNWVQNTQSRRSSPAIAIGIIAGVVVLGALSVGLAFALRSKGTPAALATEAVGRDIAPPLSIGAPPPSDTIPPIASAPPSTTASSTSSIPPSTAPATTAGKTPPVGSSKKPPDTGKGTPKKGTGLDLFNDNH